MEDDQLENNEAMDCGDIESTRKENKKRKLSSAKAPSKKKEKIVITEQEKKEYLALFSESVKQEFEETRDEILHSIPEWLKDLFGQIIFAKSSNSYYPALVLNPFHVPPGEVRFHWTNHYEKLKAQGRVSEMDFSIIYWYGYAHDINQCYGYVRQPSVLTYEQGVKKGLLKSREKDRERAKGKSKVSAKEEASIRTLNELEEDLPKEPSERRRGVIDFPECYELFVWDKEMEANYLAEKGLVSSDSEVSDSKQKSAVRKSSSGNKRGAKKSTESSQVDTIEANEHLQEEQAVTPGIIDDIHEFGDAEEDEDDAALETDDEADEDYQDDKAAPDTKDLVLVETAPRVSSKKSSSKMKREPKAATAKRREKLEENPLLREKIAFRRCERDFIPVIECWRDAIDANDAKTLGDCIQKIQDGVEQMPAHFIKLYLVETVKQTKGFAKTAGSSMLTEKLKDVKKLLIDRFDKMMPSVPKNFIPPKPKNFRNTKAEHQATNGSGEKSQRSTMSVEVSSEPLHQELKNPDPSVQKNRGLSERSSEIGQIKTPLSPSEMTKKDSKSAGICAAIQPKSDKRAFSLGRLMHRDEIARTSSSSISAGASKVPGWVTGPWTDDNIQDSDRKLALCYLRDLAESFPALKVDIESFSRALEKALWDANTKDGTATLDAYWQQLHALIATICSKRGNGTVMNLIASGDFPSAEAVVRLRGEDYLP